MFKRSTAHEKSRLQRGDTIIEVLLAIGVLAVLIVTTYTVMTRSLGMTFNSLDRTNTQAVMNGQVNMLRAAHAKYIDPSSSDAEKQPWRDIVLKVRNTQSESAADKTNRNNGCAFGVSVANTFYFRSSNATLATATNNVRQATTGAIPTPGDGLWIEGYLMTRDSGGSIVNNVYTFYVKSCTSPIYGDGSDINRQAKTAVRLYAP